MSAALTEKSYVGPELTGINPDWEILSLEEVCEKIFDCPHSTPKLADEGFFMVRTPDIRGGYFDTTNAVKVSKETYLERTKRAVPTVGDILLSREGTYFGDAAEVPDDTPLCLGQRMVLLRPNREKIRTSYLRIWINSGIFQRYLIAFRDGSVAERLNVSTIRKLPVPIPRKEIQDAIIAVCIPLEEKQQNNHQMNATLEEMAQALFKRWFVDFEFPYDFENARPDPNGQPYKSSGGKMVDSELGMIPEGWEVSSVGQDFDVTMGQSPPGNTYNEDEEGMPFFQGRRDFGWRYPTNRIFCSAPKRLAKKSDTLLSVRAPVGDINKAASDCCIGRGVAALRHKSGCEAFTYYSAMNLKQLFASYDSEGTVFGSINQKNLKALPIIQPSSEIISIFSVMTGLFDEEIQTLTEQMVTLETQRDALLPRLLSGELDISEIELPEVGNG
jgi:type I restriction enzyme S subunit